jgi:anthranilate phosphoribosyltransferase
MAITNMKFTSVLERLIRKEGLSGGEIPELAEEVVRGNLTVVQVSALLTALYMHQPKVPS